MKLEPRKKIFVSILVFAVLYFVLIVMVIYPLQRELKSNSEGLVIEKGRLAQLKEEIKGLRESEDLYRSSYENIERIDALFVNAEVPIEFMNFLEGSAADSQIGIDVSSVGEVKKESGWWPSINFQISMTGPLPQCLKFLERLEAGPYLIEISNLSVKRLAESEVQSLSLQGKNLAAGDVNMNVLIKVFAK